ncbi:hypothetical protein RB620_09620 [Paenibacillus sp. LHD-117]|uniref:hypothetical protein n=1 Tax=Paenibacillus sp. LHD-117 TaxID=3071412 RepID=UPI0027DED645|nr:hypothetical protein [Paenibacillus sp. LHD-117]MDQ6419688.1 hypothetical protein [Paenibacillus sp. LHD-117]
MKLAFRVFEDSQDVHMQATPKFVFEAGAQGYAPQSNAGFKTPYLTDPVCKQKFENSVNFSPQKFDGVNYTQAAAGAWANDATEKTAVFTAT